MKKQSLQEQLETISNIMGINKPIVNESASLIAKVGQSILKFIERKALAELPELVQVVKKAEREGVENLTENELKLIFKNLNYTALAKEIYNSGAIIPTKSITTSLNNQKRLLKEYVDGQVAKARKEGDLSPQAEQEIIKKAARDYYDELLNAWQNSLRPNVEGKAFFNLMENSNTPEIKKLADEYYKIMVRDFDILLKDFDPTIAKYAKSSNLKAPRQDVLKKNLAAVIPKNLTTITRVLTRMNKDQEVLLKEFEDTAFKMADDLRVGRYSNYYPNKLVDILTTATKEAEADFETLWESVFSKNVPEIVKNKLSAKDKVRVVVDALKSVEETEVFLTKYVNQWLELLPFLKKNIGGERSESFWKRWAMFVLKGTPDTWGEIVLKLQEKGLKKVAAEKIAAAYIAKYTLGPLLVGIISTLKNITGEGFQALGYLFDNDTLKEMGSIESEGFVSWTNELLKSSFSELKNRYAPSGVWGYIQAIFPFTTYVDNLLALGEKLNKAQAEDLIDTKLEPSVKNEVDKLRQEVLQGGSKFGETKEVLNEDELKALIPQEFHQFLGRTIEKKGDGTTGEFFELRNPKKDESYKIYKDKGIWGIEAEDKNNQVVLLALDNPKVISMINAAMK